MIYSMFYSTGMHCLSYISMHLCSSTKSQSAKNTCQHFMLYASVCCRAFFDNQAATGTTDRQNRQDAFENNYCSLVKQHNATFCTALLVTHSMLQYQYFSLSSNYQFATILYVVSYVQQIQQTLFDVVTLRHAVTKKKKRALQNPFAQLCLQMTHNWTDNKTELTLCNTKLTKQALGSLPLRCNVI